MRTPDILCEREIRKFDADSIWIELELLRTELVRPLESYLNLERVEIVMDGVVVQNREFFVCQWRDRNLDGEFLSLGIRVLTHPPSCGYGPQVNWDFGFPENVSYMNCVCEQLRLALSAKDMSTKEIEVIVDQIGEKLDSTGLFNEVEVFH